MSLIAEVEAGPAVVTEAGVLTLVLVNALGGPQSPLACRAAGNRNKTQLTRLNMPWLQCVTTNRKYLAGSCQVGLHA